MSHLGSRSSSLPPTRLVLLALTWAALLTSGAAHAQDYRYWTSCPTFASRPLATTLGIGAGFCDRYTFVRGAPSTGAAEQLYLVARTSTPTRLSGGDPLVFLDVDSMIATLNFAVDVGGPRPTDAFALWMLRRALGAPADLPSVAFTLPRPSAVELLVDAQFFALAARLGVFFPVQDGTAAFAGLVVVQVPELNMLLVSAELTEEGRLFFRTFRDRGIGGLDALIAWRVVHQFGSGGIEVVSTGWFPCIQAGPRITTAEQLAQIDPSLLLAPIDLSNMTQMVHCK